MRLPTLSSAVRVVPVLPEPSAVLGLVAAEAVITISHSTMLFYDVTSQLEGVQGGEPAAVADCLHFHVKVSVHPPALSPAVHVVPVLPEPRAVLGLVAAEAAPRLVHALEVRQHGGTVVGGETTICKHGL